MAKFDSKSKVNKLKKRTKSGGSKPKTSAMGKHEKRSFKRDRGQGG